MKVAMSGASGFVGGHLSRKIISKGWHVVRIGRNDLRRDREVLAGYIKDAEVVVNLAGAPIIAKWTEEYKRVLYSSRIDTTRKIVESFHAMDKKPDLFISTSAIGIYSTEGTHTEEKHVLATDFLGMLARDWEQEALKARELRIRTAVLRFGIVLGKDGGALKQMLPPFKLGLGGTIGEGRQAFSWIHIEDLLNAYLSIIEDESYEGIYNLTAPEATTNRELTKALGRALNRPTFFRVPFFVLKQKFGEGAQVLTQGQRVIPQRLLDRGFTFGFPEIEGAIRDLVT